MHTVEFSYYVLLMIVFYFLPFLMCVFFVIQLFFDSFQVPSCTFFLALTITYRVDLFSCIPSLPIRRTHCDTVTIVFPDSFSISYL